MQSLINDPWPPLKDSFASSLSMKFKPVMENVKPPPSDDCVSQHVEGVEPTKPQYDGGSPTYSPLSPRGNIDRAALRWGCNNEHALIQKPKARRSKSPVFPRGAHNLSLLQTGLKRARGASAFEVVMPPLLILTAAASNAVPMPLPAADETSSTVDGRGKKKGRKTASATESAGGARKSAPRTRSSSKAEEILEDGLLCSEEMPSPELVGPYRGFRF